MGGIDEARIGLQLKCGTAELEQQPAQAERAFRRQASEQRDGIERQGAVWQESEFLNWRKRRQLQYDRHSCLSHRLFAKTKCQDCPETAG